MLLCYSCHEIHKKWKDFKLHKTAGVQDYLQNPEKFIMVSSEQKQQEPIPVAGKVLHWELTEDHQTFSCGEESKNTLKITEEFGKMKIEKNNKACPSHIFSHSVTALDIQNQSAANYPLFMAKYDYLSILYDIVTNDFDKSIHAG